jgi:polysaccharide deacetylase family protein (PEP-CTERM system associated)
VINIFSVDVEHWFHANYAGESTAARGFEHLVIEETESILGLLERTGNHGTFFILGEVAEQHPGLVRTIAQAGHEVASHSYTHDLVTSMSRSQFREQARRSKDALETIVGQPVYGFRAPSWSVGVNTPWFWEELREIGYRYSSSLFPLRTFMYGDADAPRFRHERDRLIEFPPTTAELLGRRAAFSGGFYLRVLPRVVVRGLERRVNREGQQVVLYIHPREIDPSQPRLELSPLHRLIHYWGIRGTKRKVHRLLRGGRYQSFAASLGLEAEPAAHSG